MLLFFSKIFHHSFFFFFQAEDGIRDLYVTGVQTCALPISGGRPVRRRVEDERHGAWRCVVGLPAGEQRYRGRLGDAQVRQLQHEDQNVLGTKLQITWLLLAVILCAPRALAQPPLRDVGDVRLVLDELREASFVEKERIVERLSGRGDPSIRPVLSALLEDRLFVRESDRHVFIVKSADDSLASLELIDPVSLAGAGSASRDDLTKIGTNNQLRKRLRALVARFDLSGPDAAVRLAAVEEILRSLDAESLALLRARSA